MIYTIGNELLYVILFQKIVSEIKLELFSKKVFFLKFNIFIITRYILLYIISHIKFYRYAIFMTYIYYDT